jgi:hypothetical protein
MLWLTDPSSDDTCICWARVATTSKGLRLGLVHEAFDLLLSSDTAVHVNIGLLPAAIHLGVPPVGTSVAGSPGQALPKAQHSAGTSVHRPTARIGRARRTIRPPSFSKGDRLRRPE